MELIDKQKSIGKQYKSFNIKAENLDLVSRKISGYAAIFNNVDKSKDMLIRGCFAKSTACYSQCFGGNGRKSRIKAVFHVFGQGWHRL